MDKIWKAPSAKTNHSYHRASGVLTVLPRDAPDPLFAASRFINNTWTHHYE